MRSSKDVKVTLRTIVEEYKSGFYGSSANAARQIAIAIDRAASKELNFAWLMILLDDHLPTQSTPLG